MKRVFDFTMGTVVLCFLSPVLLTIGIIVGIKLGRPILYRQVRAGRYGRPFSILKFRTMSNECDSNGHLLPDDQRLSKFGLFLRKYSLDELPQLWNVIKGDMSLVGPRPLLVEYCGLYTPEQARRLQLRPGITGWQQVNGRNSVDWEQKFVQDVWYVENQTFLLDLRILLRTISCVLSADGIGHGSHKTMPPFMGSSSRVEKIGNNSFNGG